MSLIPLTEGNDTYVQSRSQHAQGWQEIQALGGDDRITVFGYQVQPGPGNDLVERVPLDGQLQWVSVVYWGSPRGIRVDLVTGLVQDGWGGTDRLIRIHQIGGTEHDDQFRGDGEDNFFWPIHGRDTVDGGGGQDGVRLPWSFLPASGGDWREALFSDVSIDVSADGRRATVSGVGREGTSFTYSLTDVEFIEGRAVADGPEVRVQLADRITLATIARDTIAAGADFRWNAPAPLGTPVDVRFSFVEGAPTTGPGAVGFRSFTPAERQLVREALAKVEKFAGLTFVEVNEAGGTTGQLRFGVSQQAATKGLSWLPGQADAGELAGDVWMDVESMLGLAPGTAGYQALLHEIGHALGLRHPRNVDPADAWAVQMRAQDDQAGLSVMSQALQPSGVFHADWAPLDVLALRLLYGTRTVATGDDLHRLGPDHARRLSTLADDGGIDTLDASGIGAGVRLSLVPGTLSSVGLSAEGRLVVDNLALADGTWIEHAIGTPHDDQLMGNRLDNRLDGRGGNDWIDGGDGRDTAVLPWSRADTVMVRESGSLYIEAADGRSGSTRLDRIERVVFTDGGLALDLDGHAGSVAQILRGLFGSSGLANPVYAGLGLQLMDAGMPFKDLVGLALSTPVFEALAGGRSNERFVDWVYRNVVGSAPDAESLSLYRGLLDSGAFTQTDLAVLALTHPLNTASAELVGLAETGLPYTPMG